MKTKGNEVVLFQSENKDITIPVSIDGETVWLNRKQMAELFERDIKTIGKHIKNVLNEELSGVSVVANFATTANDGKIYNVDYYNLDVIISVGYRVKSKRGVEFRRWANKVLKQYIINGYALNEKRLLALHKTIEIQNNLIKGFVEIAGMEGNDVLEVIDSYSKALHLLDDYDHQTIIKPKGKKTIAYISEEYCNNVIEHMKSDINSDLFGKEREKGLLKGILDQIAQNVYGQEIYVSLEEKASNLLYMLVKDHIYYDGNKRIAALLFLTFLNVNNALYTEEKRQIISNTTLVAITLMIACSDSREKEIFISIVMNLLMDKVDV